MYSKDVKTRQYLPILDWTADDVAEFLSERGVKCHPLYYDETGAFHAERRLGCICCPLMSKNKRIVEFKRYPNMVRFYVRGAQKFLDRHPDSKIGKRFNGNVYDGGRCSKEGGACTEGDNRR